MLQHKEKECVSLQLFTASQQKQQLQIKTTICCFHFNILHFPDNTIWCRMWCFHAGFNNPAMTCWCAYVLSHKRVSHTLIAVGSVRSSCGGPSLARVGSTCSRAPPACTSAGTRGLLLWCLQIPFAAAAGESWVSACYFPLFSLPYNQSRYFYQPLLSSSAAMSVLSRWLHPVLDYSLGSKPGLILQDVSDISVWCTRGSFS